MANAGDYKLENDIVSGFDGSSWVVVPGASVSENSEDMQVIVRVGSEAVPAPSGVLLLVNCYPGSIGFVSVSGNTADPTKSVDVSSD